MAYWYVTKPDDESSQQDFIIKKPQECDPIAVCFSGYEDARLISRSKDMHELLKTVADHYARDEVSENEIDHLYWRINTLLQELGGEGLGTQPTAADVQEHTRGQFEKIGTALSCGPEVPLPPSRAEMFAEGLVKAFEALRAEIEKAKDKLKDEVPSFGALGLVPDGYTFEKYARVMKDSAEEPERRLERLAQDIKRHRIGQNAKATTAADSRDHRAAKALMWIFRHSFNNLALPPLNEPPGQGLVVEDPINPVEGSDDVK